MGDKMRMVPFGELLERMFEEYRSQKSIFDCAEASWYRKADGRTIDILGEHCGTALGPAAGPHTQLAQNIVTAYLTGSRFIELKTVQKLDSLVIEKPCIDAHDEGYNTEWSTELSLQEAWEEYAKAWILLHIVEELFDFKLPDLDRSFVFNMSVGYDLEGIKTARMQKFIARMKDSGSEPLFREWLEETAKRVPALLAGTGLERKSEAIRDLSKRSPSEICRSVTLSTMHGCPPGEIEAICRYMIIEQDLDTYVKLNPTLLGFDTAKRILDDLGYDYVELNPESFAHDLQYDEALGILARLRETARENGRRFGVKLTNTLGVVNNRNELPDKEMYLSGRALYPLTITLAARLSAHFDGDLLISYSGGITINNVAAVFQTGIRPITMATELLKPGGFQRQVQMAEALDKMDGWDRGRIDVTALNELAVRSLNDPTARKDFRDNGEVASEGALPLFDCYEAPCVTACAIHQHIPEYIRLVGEQRFAEALEVIYERNALPSITGHICDAKCQLVCTRLDYEGCLNIREIKKIAVLQGYESYKARWKKPEAKRSVRAAVVGAGPAGLSAAYFLAREGFAVTVFEREADAGGVVRYVVPHFRITREAIEADVDFIRDHGVEFIFNAGERIDVNSLKAEGFKYVVMGLGTYQIRSLPIEGDNTNIIPSLRFLRDFNDDTSKMKIGRHAVVIGAGDSAMDAARSALRCPGVETSTIVYRRSFGEMPASREEYTHCVGDGVAFRWLRNPERFDSDGTLTVRVMTLGEPDATGRRSPLPTESTETMKADTLIYAIGDDVESSALRRVGLHPDSTGKLKTKDGGETEVENLFLIGDSRTGASTIVQCIAEGRRAADAICRKEDPSWKHHEAVPRVDPDVQIVQLTKKRGSLTPKPDAAKAYDTATFARIENQRCLECNYVCNKCVDVCPNRANIAVPVQSEKLFSNPFEIVHIDAYCNECGDCGHFCPWEGRPYIDKPTVFSLREDFDNSENPGWLVTGNSLHVRFEGTVKDYRLENGGVKDAPANDIKAMQFFRLFEVLYRERPHLFGPVDVEEKAGAAV